MCSNDELVVKKMGNLILADNFKASQGAHNPKWQNKMQNLLIQKILFFVYI